MATRAAGSRHAGAPAAVEADGRRIEVPRPEKLLFPQDGITKTDLVAYYLRIAPVMVPHLRGRPLMLERYPDGIERKGFYQKDASDHFPDWVRRVEVQKAGGTVHHVVCDDAATLVYLASQACITPHAWTSRVDRLDRPDRMVFDLDPPGERFDLVRRAARQLGELLEGLGLTPFLMTTGSRGAHVVVPLSREDDFDAVRDFAHAVAGLLARQDPGRLTIEQRKAKRGERLFVDVMRNGYAQTAVPPYAVRPLRGAPVATPLDWGELGRGQGPRRHNIGSILRRLARKRDPWAEIDRDARSLGEARRRLNALRRGRR
jgi:bifunctional non-homologous end joining protein LigD